MNNQEKENLKDEIKDIKKENIEELLLMIKYCFNAYIKSIITFGINHAITKDTINVLKEFIKIINKEKEILDLILKNANKEDVNEINEFLSKLDDLNEVTLKYYYNVLDGIEDACDMKTEWRAKRPPKNFETLIETNKYHNKLYELTLSIEDIKTFFNYEEEFWQYIKDRLFIIDSRLEKDNSIYGVNLKLDNDYLIDIKVIIPQIINLDTALINIHELKHAYDLYKVLGNKNIKSDEEYEFSAKICEQKFKETYLVKKHKNKY